jgi:hypothetical protein
MVIKKNLLSPFTLFSTAIVINGILLFFVFPWLLDTFKLYNANGYPDGYEKLAKSLVNGEGYRFYPHTGETTLRAPLYPLFLSFLFKYIGENIQIAQMANFLMVIAIAGLTRLLCAITYPNIPLLSTIATLIVLIHPGIIIAETRGGVEIALTLGIITCIVFLVLAVKHRNYYLYFAAGLLLGITSLIKSTPLLFPLVFLPYLLYRFGTQKILINVFTPMLLLLLGIIIVLSPWIYRNYNLTGKFVPTMSILGVSMMHGQHICKNINMEVGAGKLVQEATDELVDLARSNKYEFSGANACCGPFFLNTVDEVNFTDGLKTTAINQYLANPIFTLKCTALNLAGFVAAGRNHTSTLLNLIIQLPLFALALVGIIKLPNRNHLALLTIIFMAYYTAVHLPIMAIAKYSIPIMPLFSMFAAYGLIATLSRHLTNNHLSQNNRDTRVGN